jgi:hypothetical protein
VASAEAEPSAAGGPRTSLWSLLAHPPLTTLIVTAIVAAATLTWLDPASLRMMCCSSLCGLQLACRLLTDAEIHSSRLTLHSFLTQVLGPHCEIIGFSVPGIGLLFGLQSAMYAVSSPLAGCGYACDAVTLLSMLARVEI